MCLRDVHTVVVALCRAIGTAFFVGAALVQNVTAAPTAVNGSPFTLVATKASAPQLFELTSDTTGKIYTGNNSNDVTGIPVQVFDPALFSGVPLALQNFGPSLGDADGI